MARVKRIPGELRSGRFIKRPSFIRKINRTKGSKRAGELFEEKVHVELRKKFRDRYVSGAWIEYDGDLCGIKVCQPDGIIFDFERGIITVVECKLSFTADAWYQLNELYIPVLRVMFPEDLWQIRGVQIYKFAAGGVKYPEYPRVVWRFNNFDGGHNIMRWTQ